MLGVAEFLLILFFSLLFQEILDRAALRYLWIDKFCILFSILMIAFCLMVMNPESKLRASDGYVYLIGSVFGLIYFSIIRNWFFPVRVRKHSNTRF